VVPKSAWTISQENYFVPTGNRIQDPPARNSIYFYYMTVH